MSAMAKITTASLSPEERVCSARLPEAAVATRREREREAGLALLRVRRSTARSLAGENIDAVRANGERQREGEGTELERNGGGEYNGTARKSPTPTQPPSVVRRSVRLLSGSIGVGLEY